MHQVVDARQITIGAVCLGAVCLELQGRTPLLLRSPPFLGYQPNDIRDRETLLSFIATVLPREVRTDGRRALEE